MPGLSSNPNSRDADGTEAVLSVAQSMLPMGDDEGRPGSWREFVTETSSSVPHLLFVEANLVYRNWQRNIIEQLGYTVDCANDGRECLSLLEYVQYDLILTSIQMPRMDGIQATRLIRAANALSRSGRLIPIIALVSNDSLKEFDHCIDAGMNDCLLKPVGIKQLKMSVEHWLDESMTA